MPHLRGFITFTEEHFKLESHQWITYRGYTLEKCWTLSRTGKTFQMNDGDSFRWPWSCILKFSLSLYESELDKVHSLVNDTKQKL